MGTSETTVVAGGGPVGLTVALGLARAGRPVTVVPGLRSTRPRPVVLHPLLRPFIDELGILPDLERVGIAWRHFVVSTPGERLRIDIGGAAPTGADAMGSDQGVHRAADFPSYLTISRDGLLDVLDRAVRSAGGTILDGARIVALEEPSGGVVAHVRSPDGDLSVPGRYLVAADGTRSTIRRCLGIGFSGITWRSALGHVTLGPLTVAANPLTAVAAYRTRPGLLELTAPDGGLHVGLGLADVPTGESRTEQVRRLLPEEYAAEAQLISVRTMHERCAGVLYRGHVLLAGDAAHVTSPLTEYAAIGGLWGAAAAVDAVLAAQAGDHTALSRYSVERRRTYKLFLRPLAYDVLGQVFWPGDRTAEEAAMTSFRQLATSPEALREHLQLAQTLRHGRVADTG